MNWIVISQIAYIAVIITVCLIILYNTRSHNKSLVYILLVIFLPVIGVALYLIFGFNYHKLRLFRNMPEENKKLRERINLKFDNHNKIADRNGANLKASHRTLSDFIFEGTSMPITDGNSIELLVNGESKFPEVLKMIREAKHHIHLEYYIFNDDETSKDIVDLLIIRAHEGINIKFIYDDFGSRNIGDNVIMKMKNAGIKVQPFYEIKYMLLANRINYRNHRKIIVIDGTTAFVGGINIGNEYDNKIKAKGKVYWRDTHLKVSGPIVKYLQCVFLQDWNFCCQDYIVSDDKYFPEVQAFSSNKKIQLAVSGPDTSLPYIEYTMLRAIYSARESIMITTPYFIPGEPILDALIAAQKSGVEVSLLVPNKSDSKIVNTAAKFYYTQLIEEGVTVYLYTKGFVHAKSMVIDEAISIIGSANMDIRSFDLNFEVNAVVYDQSFAKEMKDVFYTDTSNSKKIDREAWLNRSKIAQFPEKVMRLISQVL